MVSLAEIQEKLQQLKFEFNKKERKCQQQYFILTIFSLSHMCQYMHLNRFQLANLH